MILIHYFILAQNSSLYTALIKECMHTCNDIRSVSTGNVGNRNNCAQATENTLSFSCYDVLNERAILFLNSSYLNYHDCVN